MTIARILATGIKHRMTGSEVYGRQQDMPAASLTSTLNNGLAIGLKLLSVQVTMGIDKLHQGLTK